MTGYEELLRIEQFIRSPVNVKWVKVTSDCLVQGFDESLVDVIEQCADARPRVKGKKQTLELILDAGYTKESRSLFRNFRRKITRENVAWKVIVSSDHLTEEATDFWSEEGFQVEVVFRKLSPVLPKVSALKKIKGLQFSYLLGQEPETLDNVCSHLYTGVGRKIPIYPKFSTNPHDIWLLSLEDSKKIFRLARQKALVDLLNLRWQEPEVILFKRYIESYIKYLSEKMLSRGIEDDLGCLSLDCRDIKNKDGSGFYINYGESTRRNLIEIYNKTRRKCIGCKFFSFCQACHYLLSDSPVQRKQCEIEKLFFRETQLLLMDLGMENI